MGSEQIRLVENGLYTRRAISNRTISKQIVRRHSEETSCEQYA